MKRNILITGGAGFIGSHVVRLFVGKYPDYRIVNLDRLTYAGNLANLRDVENRPNYTFVKGDICDYDAMRSLFAEYDIDGVIHLAAESHVDRSIRDPFTFARTNVMGTLTLLQAAREQIAVYSEWIKNCTELKHSSQAQLLSGMSKEALEAALAALNAQ